MSETQVAPIERIPVSTAAFVHRTISRIQSGYVRSPQAPASRAALAQLRRGVGRQPGEIAEILPFIVNPGAPATRSAVPTTDERAIYLVMTLYAYHQQSQRAPMYVPKVSFGAALGHLRYKDGVENPGVVRRFQAMGTAATFEELAHHARSLVALLRSAGLGFDYAQLARDLVDFLDPRKVDAVRLRWGRDFYRVPAPSTVETTPEEQQS